MSAEGQFPIAGSTNLHRIFVAVPTASPAPTQPPCPRVGEGGEAEKVDESLRDHPGALYAVGYWYEDFTQTTDQEVRRCWREPRISRKCNRRERTFDSTPPQKRDGWPRPSTDRRLPSTRTR